MDIGNVIEKMIMLFCIMLIGFIGNKAGVLDGTGNKKFSALVVNITAPALILASSADENLSGDKNSAILMLLAAFGVYLFLLLLSFLVGAILKKEPGGSGLYRFMTVFGNNAFMGIPVVDAIFGTVFYAALFNLPNNLLIYSLGSYLLSGKEGKKSSFSIKQILNPGTLSAAVALIMFLCNLRFPAPVLGTLQTVGNITTPLSMLVIGSTLAETSVRSTFGNWKIYVFGVFKLLVIPLTVFLLGSLIIKDSLILGVLTVLSAMPCAAVTTMLCEETGQDAKTAAKYIFITTLMSVITIPLVAFAFSKWI